jgi:uncharacterized radical SAM superfamily Fe-S cluster-containing enzyme
MASDEALPHQTQSLCPGCLTVINAVLYEEDDRVLMKKHCSVHGTFTELISSDATFLIVDSRTNQAIPIPAFVDVEPLMETMRSAAEQLQRGGLFRRIGVSQALRRFYHEETAPEGWSFDLFVDYLMDFADFRERYRTNQDRVETTRKARHRSMLMASMHFQDAYNYQLDRVRRCVVQYAAPDGRLYPFCSYNSGPCHRQRVEDQFAVPLDRSESVDTDGVS